MKSSLFIFLWTLVSLNPHTASASLQKRDPGLKMDTIYIGATRDFTSLNDYFASEGKKENVHLLLDEGTYYSTNLWIDGEHLVIEGVGKVNLYCTEMYENVMWIIGKHIHVKNIHMKHFAPGNINEQNCSGRVIGFDNAEHITIENCDLNGCGVAGLHDNGGNSEIFVKNNYIHNNSAAAYTNDRGDIWFKEVKDHPVFRFENNRIENNGPDRKRESDAIEDYILSCPLNHMDELIQQIQYEIDQWKDVPNPLIAKYRGTDIGDYYHIIFEDSKGKSYDFGFGNNDFSAYPTLEHVESSEDVEFVGEEFTIFWDWKVSSFPCCSGEYEIVEAYIPTITGLELVKPEKRGGKKKK